METMMKWRDQAWASDDDIPMTIDWVIPTPIFSLLKWLTLTVMWWGKSLSKSDQCVLMCDVKKWWYWNESNQYDVNDNWKISSEAKYWNYVVLTTSIVTNDIIQWWPVISQWPVMMKQWGVMMKKSQLWRTGNQWWRYWCWLIFSILMMMTSVEMKKPILIDEMTNDKAIDNDDWCEGNQSVLTNDNNDRASMIFDIENDSNEMTNDQWIFIIDQCWQSVINWSSNPDNQISNQWYSMIEKASGQLLMKVILLMPDDVDPIDDIEEKVTDDDDEAPILSFRNDIDPFSIHWWYVNDYSVTWYWWCPTRYDIRPRWWWYCWWLTSILILMMIQWN